MLKDFIDQVVAHFEEFGFHVGRLSRAAQRQALRSVYVRQLRPSAGRVWRLAPHESALGSTPVEPLVVTTVVRI